MFGALFGVIFFLATAIVHVSLAIGVLKDGESLRSQGAATLFAPPALWGFATLIGGLIVVAIYWVIHHSTLSRQ